MVLEELKEIATSKIKVCKNAGIELILTPALIIGGIVALFLPVENAIKNTIAAGAFIGAGITGVKGAKDYMKCRDIITPGVKAIKLFSKI